MLHRLSFAAQKVVRLAVQPKIAVLLYLGLAIASTWPLATGLTTRFPLGASRADTVPLFNVWTIWWNADRAAHGFANYWNAPIFHPATNTFAYSEPQPMTLVVAPVIWLTGSPVLAYNLYLLLSLTLNGFVGAATLRSFRVRRMVALFGGAVILLLPLVHWQSDVVQLVPLWPSLWVLAVFIRMSRRLRFRTGCEAGIALAVTFLSCGHHGLFLAILLCGSGWLLITPIRRLKTWGTWGLCGLVAALGVLPVASKLREVAEVRQFERSQESVAKLSLLPGDYTAARGWQLADPGLLAARSRWRTSPGLLKYALALAGLGFGLWRRRTRRVTAFLAVFGLLAFALSLGSNLVFFGWQPWRTIADLVPGAGQVRSVFRFAFFFQMTVVLLAGSGASLLWSWTRNLRRRFLPANHAWIATQAAGIALVCVCIASVVEVLPHRPTLGCVPDATSHADWIAFVRNNTPHGRAVACVPFATGNRVNQFQATMWWMFLGTKHGVPLANGYSGFFPREYFSLRKLVNESFPEEGVLRQFEQIGVEFVLVATRQIPSDDLLLETVSSPLLERAFHGEAGVDVYRIRLPQSERR
jgi:hypothetical protein